MKRFNLRTAALLCSLLPSAAFAQSGALRHATATTDATPVPTMMMGTHMQMSIKTEPKPGDTARAAAIADTARGVLIKYKDVATAERDGYRPFFPTGKMGEEVHYVNGLLSMAEQRHVDYAHPGSILYKRTPEGMVAVGVMYMAPADATAAALDLRAPMSIAPWHRHVDLCSPPANTPDMRAQLMDPKAQFGFLGSIHTDEACKAAGGHWVPLAFGWMTHVYPNETDPSKVWGGAKMEMSDDMDM